MILLDKTPWDNLFDEVETKNHIPMGLLKAVARAESGYDPEAVSPVGAAGIMQFMPATANNAGFGILPFDPFDAEASIRAAGAYLGGLRGRVKNWPEALAAYNWGLGNVLRKGIAAAPKETRDYVSKITTWAGIEFTAPTEWTV